jgi:hypothetical protein
VQICPPLDGGLTRDLDLLCPIPVIEQVITKLNIATAKVMRFILLLLMPWLPLFQF